MAELHAECNRLRAAVEKRDAVLGELIEMHAPDSPCWCPDGPDNKGVCMYCRARASVSVVRLDGGIGAGRRRLVRAAKVDQ